MLQVIGFGLRNYLIGHSRPLSCSFSILIKQIKIYNKILLKMCRNSNTRPLVRGSFHITTRPGLSPEQHVITKSHLRVPSINNFIFYPKVSIVGYWISSCLRHYYHHRDCSEFGLQSFFATKMY